MSDLELLFLARNRLEFTREALSALHLNTNWKKVKKLWLYDDGSTDGTREYLQTYKNELNNFKTVEAELRTTNLGSPILVTNNFITRTKSPLLAKIDNDTILPPGWLDLSLEIMEAQPEVDCLGLEYRGLNGGSPAHAITADHIGGLYVAHRRAFEHGDLPIPSRKYFGWQDYQYKHNLRRCWIQPSIPVFLLDRVPEEPYASLSRKYEAAGWQRDVPQWDYKPEQSELWKWWTQRNAA